VGVLSSEGTDPGGTALRRCAEGQFHPETAPRQLVEMGSPDEPVALGADIAPAEVVRHQYNDVGWVLRLDQRWGMPPDCYSENSGTSDYCGPPSKSQG
jgi:hypothetical protein